MDVHRPLLRLSHCLGYCLLSLVIVGCDITITINRKDNGTSPIPQEQIEQLGKGTDSRNKPTQAAQCIITQAQSFIGIHEKGGANRGKEVEAIQKEAGVPIGSPWCQSFVLVCFNRCNVSHKMDGRAASACQQRVTEAQAGDVICFDWNGDGKIQHSGIVEKDEGQRFVTIEGNTSDPDKRQTDGVYRKFRNKSIRYELGRW